MSKYTKLLKFDKNTAQKIMDRDQGCYFCRIGYHLPDSSIQCQIKDIMHVVPKSSLGLGIEQNGVEGCRYHHSLMDNGNKGLRSEMLGMLKSYLSGLYPGWNENNVTYKKWTAKSES